MVSASDDGAMNTVMPGMEAKAWVEDVVKMEFK
jgi:hypothetical protein